MNESKARLCRSCESRSSNLCNLIGGEDFSRLTEVTEKLRADRGMIFITEGDPADHFFSITEGVATLFKLMIDGRRQITGFARRGDFLGLAFNDRYAFSAEAVGHVELCRHSRSGMQGLFRDFPAMQRGMLTLTSNELVAAQEQMLLLGRKTARERVASFLLTEIARQHMRGKREPVIDLPMPRADISDYLGLTNETVCRAFSWLKAEAIIVAPNPHRVFVRDLDRLQIAAEGAIGRQSMLSLARDVERGAAVGYSRRSKSPPAINWPM